MTENCNCGHPVTEHDYLGCQYSISKGCKCRRPWGREMEEA